MKFYHSLKLKLVSHYLCLSFSGIIFPLFSLFLLFSIKLFVVKRLSRTQIFDSDIFRMTIQCMSLIYLFVCFLIRLTVLPFLFEQICQLAGQIRATLNG